MGKTGIGWSMVMCSSAGMGACPGRPIGAGMDSRWSGVWMACWMAACAWLTGSGKAWPVVVGLGPWGTAGLKWIVSSVPVFGQAKCSTRLSGPSRSKESASHGSNAKTGTRCHGPKVGGRGSTVPRFWSASLSVTPQSDPWISQQVAWSGHVSPYPRWRWWRRHRTM